ncbi:MAG: dihydroorotate dehydrogenase electron transfer subunit [Lentisphaerae bacterium]|nr:dihydroorotate dehydrogenase electron transfer subunit [Lentisphaerota bacterium]MCP4100585.1 dihydroorotate dehydrogenase electron transfer subunit [Lentisphaerota bacterium]
MKKGEIVTNSILKDEYYQVQFYVPEICRETRPGQFVHVKIANLRDRILRRPFSISDVSEDGLLTVVYKVVGEGTKVLAELKPGEVCDLMGPLGNPFSVPAEDEFPVIVAGGYGSAATYLLAERAPTKGVLLLGARSQNDLILTDKFAAAGFDVRTSTNDGSEGYKGFVTELIPQVLEENQGKKIRFYGCGPTPMLLALAKILQDKGYNDGELSLDHLMCCGVGACFACVVKIKDDNPDGWRYARTCKEGPVFKASDVYVGE